MTSPKIQKSRGRAWFDALNEESTVDDQTTEVGPSLRVGVVKLGEESADLVAVVPDHESPFPRARNGEVGLRESLDLAATVRSQEGSTRPLIVVVDVPGQAFGYNEELFGLNSTMAMAVNAIAKARMGGRPIVAFVVGKAISGAFLTTGLQANRIILLDDHNVQVQVMGKKAAARITRRTVEELDEMAKTVPATAFDGGSFTTLGAVAESISPENPAKPSAADVSAAVDVLGRQIRDIRTSNDRTLTSRLQSEAAATGRALSIKVREQLNSQW